MKPLKIADRAIFYLAKSMDKGPPHPIIVDFLYEYAKNPDNPASFCSLRREAQPLVQGISQNWFWPAIRP
jgi:hypothetical protein